MNTVPFKISRSEIETAFRHHFEGLHRYAYTITKNNETAKDITQEVFFILWKKKDDILINGSLKSYLYKAIYNRSINHVTREIKHTLFEEAAAGAEKESIFLHIEAKELREKIKQSINKLPPQCQSVFFKIKEENKTYSQTANELGISVKTVEAHMTKAMKILREQLSGIM